ncbi:hypothetical protein S245_045146 [Arachis hypogaea]|uniref:carbamoyl-phosphate synthase (glutamine-hydrolyzing) n=1 Tax=Arachis hypogaea TaxID=3818 RepID=A0A444ZXS3_ARAHY|nr:Carbamoyl-phosphate synthase small chain [Arachis hypogaea]RYR18977.1 hypothetical protein Ahy_B03g063608 [Arachis hypogaea]
MTSILWLQIHCWHIYMARASETLKMKPDGNGILFSNGPGDPSAVPYAVETVRDILEKVSVFGICMGHQLIGQALGGKTFKMKFGHHGENHPVRTFKPAMLRLVLRTTIMLLTLPHCQKELRLLIST